MLYIRSIILVVLSEGDKSPKVQDRGSQGGKLISIRLFEPSLPVLTLSTDMYSSLSPIESVSVIRGDK